ncbi:MAG: glutamate-5-semialdehyde dehydrogenase, partial [Acidimicrobiia bacterium]
MMDQVGPRARTASHILRQSTGELRQRALLRMAEAIIEAGPRLLEANTADLDQAMSEGISGALIDRLRLTDARIAGMGTGLRNVASLPDPVGRQTAGWVLYNGVRLHRVRVPLGVVAVIYEARPNVTADAAGLCIRSGNAVILRGSSYALRSNMAISHVLRQALEEGGLPADGVQLIEDTSRQGAKALMQATEWVDLLVPRGGPGLIETIMADATVPTVIDGAGNCHVYVDAAADLDKALRVVVNAKVQRPGVCNAAETLLVHESVADPFVVDAAKALIAEGVELRGDERSRQLVPDIGAATEADWGTEFLDLIMADATVPTVIDGAGNCHVYVDAAADLDKALRVVV